jgi:hypothetical protein
LLSGFSICAGDQQLDEFLIANAAGPGVLLFCDRSPPDPTEPIEEFWVRVTGHNVAAACQVYAGYAPSHPAQMFSNMARQWTGWSGELRWESLEGELALRCSHDRLGHISIGVEIRSGQMPDDWRLVASVTAEAGQLEDIARRAESFFGRIS